MSPEDLRRAVRGRWRWPAENVTIEAVATDSRTAGAGEVFFALRGPNFDGHRFLPAAADAGCVAAVVDWTAPLDEGVLRRFPGGVVGVQDTALALGDLASVCREHLAATVVAVTGSNGKTTVKRMIDHILSGRLKGTASPRSFNNAIGVPLTLFAVAPDDDYVVCELGTSAPGEIAALTRMARPDVAVIVSVSATHLERLADVEHVAVEKAAILGGLGPGGAGVVCAGCPPLERAMRAYDVRLIRFGLDDAADLRLTGYEPRPGGGRFQINGRAWFELAVPGRHNAVNALAAIAVAQRFGLDQASAAGALRDYRGGEMRLQTVQAGEVLIVNDAYNANPASLEAAAGALECFRPGRRVVVAADMRELGERGVELHRSSGASLAACGVDVVVGVGVLGMHVAAGAEAAGNVIAHRLESVEQACGELPKILRAGDVVLLKGSRAMAMERLIEPIRAAFAAPDAVAAAGKGRPRC